MKCWRKYYKITTEGGWSGPDLSIVRLQATVIVGPQLPHTPFFNNSPIILYFCHFFYKFWGPFDSRGPQALLRLLLCKSTIGVGACAPARFLNRVCKKFFFKYSPSPPTFKFSYPGYGVLVGQKRIVAHRNH